MWISARSRHRDNYCREVIEGKGQEVNLGVMQSSESSFANGGSVHLSLPSLMVREFGVAKKDSEIFHIMLL